MYIAINAPTRILHFSDSKFQQLAASLFLICCCCLLFMMCCCGQNSRARRDSNRRLLLMGREYSAPLLHRRCLVARNTHISWNPSLLTHPLFPLPSRFVTIYAITIPCCSTPSLHAYCSTFTRLYRAPLQQHWIYDDETGTAAVVHTYSNASIIGNFWVGMMHQINAWENTRRPLLYGEKDFRKR